MRSRQPDMHWLTECVKMDKKKALFGTGKIARTLSSDLMELDGENYYGVEIILDNDRSKAGSLFMGIKVVHPDDEDIGLICLLLLRPRVMR